MVDFDRLNRETREYKNRNVDRFNPSTCGNYTGYDINRRNNETYKQNNGEYSCYYTYR